MKKPIIRNIIITFCVGIIISAGVLIYENTQLAFEENAKRMFSDAFFIAGVILLSIGLLSMVSAGGGFDAISYMSKKIALSFRRRAKQLPSYYDYIVDRRNRGKKNTSHLVIVGAFYLVAGAVLAGIYLNS